MFEKVTQKLESGDRGGARAALTRDLGEFFKRHFVAGQAEHPVLGPEGARLVEGLRPFALSLADDPARGQYVDEVLHEVGSRIVRREGREAVMFLFNHALHLLLPEYPLVVSDALDEARQELGGRINEGDDGTTFAPFLAAESALLIAAVAHGFKGVDEARLSAIERLDLSGLDAPESTIAGLPVLYGIEGGDFVFVCPFCSGRRRAPVGAAGDAYGCDCGAWTRVPIPGLARLGAWLKAKRDRARGLGHCRICGAVIQTGKSGFMRAGFCTPICAKQGRETFREFVAAPGQRDGESVAFSCSCGSAMRAPVAAVGTRLPCAACGLDVWVPEAAAAGGRPSVAPCAKCGRPVKSTAAKCLYCGAVRSPARA
jgi:hypothetical protein